MTDPHTFSRGWTSDSSPYPKNIFSFEDDLKHVPVLTTIQNPQFTPTKSTLDKLDFGNISDLDFSRQRIITDTSAHDSTSISSSVPTTEPDSSLACSSTSMSSSVSRTEPDDSSAIESLRIYPRPCQIAMVSSGSSSLNPSRFKWTLPKLVSL
jgi:hypothetical protein